MTKDMTTGSSLKIILLFSIPVLLGNLFQQFYNMVDTIIVGRYLGEDALAAVGSTGCIMFLVLGFATGIAQGFGVMISHAFGAKDFRLLKHYVALSLILTVIVSAILTIPTVAASRLFLVWMHTPDNILSMADAYIKVIFAGIILTMLYNVSAGILRGIGDSKTPLYFLIISSILNLVLDLLFIVVLKAGTAGAAYATIIAQGISAILCFIHMFRQFEILRTTKADYYLDRPGVINMLSIGIPMALNYSITAIGTMILQSTCLVPVWLLPLQPLLKSTISQLRPCRRSAPPWQPTVVRISVQENTTVFSTVCAKDFSSVSLLQPSVLPSVFSVENLS